MNFAPSRGLTRLMLDAVHQYRSNERCALHHFIWEYHR